LGPREKLFFGVVPTRKKCVKSCVGGVYGRPFLRAFRGGALFAKSQRPQLSLSGTKNFSNTHQPPLGPKAKRIREKLMGRAGFYTEIFFPKFENYFKTDFSRAEV
jgi:hypothetical protein